MKGARSVKQLARQTRKQDIAKDLVLKRDYKGALATLGNDLVTNSYARYLGGFSLLKLGKAQEALTQWWPIVKSIRSGSRPEFSRDYELLAEFVFSESKWWTQGDWKSWPLRKLVDLLSAGLEFQPRNPFVLKLQEYVFGSLVESKDWKAIRQIIKSKHEISSLELQLQAQVEFNDSRKSDLKPFTFASLIMSAGSSYLLSHQELNLKEGSELLKGLCREIFLAFSFDSVGKTLNDEQFSLWLYLGIERRVLAKILELAASAGSSSLPDMVLSPGQIYNRVLPDEVSRRFVGWLNHICADSEILAFYDREFFAVVVSICRFQKNLRVGELKCGGPLLESVVHFYNLVRNHIKGSEFQTVSNLPLTSFLSPSNRQGLFREFAILIFKSVILNTTFKRETLLNEETMRALCDLVVAMDDQELKKSFSGLALQTIVFSINEKGPWKNYLTMFENALVSCRDFIFRAQALRERLAICQNFLDGIKGFQSDWAQSDWAQNESAENESASDPFDEFTENEEAFQNHVTLLADTVCLIPLVQLPIEEPLAKYYYKLMMKAKSLNLPTVRDVAHEMNRCMCLGCQRDWIVHIPHLARRLNYPVVIDSFKGTDELDKMRSLFLFEAPSAKVSLFNSNNPFLVLGVSPSDTKQTILAKVMQLMRDKSGEMATLREAQDKIFSPEIRFLYGFLKSYTLCFATQWVVAPGPPSLVNDSDGSADRLNSIELRARESIR